MFLHHFILISVFFIIFVGSQRPYNYYNYYQYSNNYGNYGNPRSTFGSYGYPSRTYQYYNYPTYYPQQRYQPYSNYINTNPTNIAYHLNEGNIGVGNGIASFWLSCSSHNCQG